MPYAPLDAETAGPQAPHFKDIPVLIMTAEALLPPSAHSASAVLDFIRLADTGIHGNDHFLKGAGGPSAGCEVYRQNIGQKSLGTFTIAGEGGRDSQMG